MSARLISNGPIASLHYGEMQTLISAGLYLGRVSWILRVDAARKALRILLMIEPFGAVGSAAGGACGGRSRLALSSDRTWA
jgi:hypothetical protein